MSILVKQQKMDGMFTMIYMYLEKRIEFTIVVGTDTIESVMSEFEDSFSTIFDRNITCNDRDTFSTCLYQSFPRKVGRFMMWTRASS